jgi:hypothetical protein
VCFWGSDAPPYEQNEAYPFPPVNFFLKFFPTISQSDEAQRLDVYLFRATIAKRGPKREREQGNHGEIDGETEPTPPPLRPARLSLANRVECITLPSPSLSPTPYTTHYTLHPAPYTTLCTLHTTHYTTPCTLHPALHTAPAVSLIRHRGGGSHERGAG